MAEAKDVLPWVAGAVGLPVAGYGGYRLWKYLQGRRQPDADISPLTSDEIDKVPSLVCLATRSGVEGTDDLAAAVAVRLRPDYSFPPPGSAGPNQRDLWAALRSEVEALETEAALQATTICGLLEDSPPQPEPDDGDDFDGQAIKPIQNSAFAIRRSLNALGYPIAVNNSPVAPKLPFTNARMPDPTVIRYQSDWNKVVSAVKAGKLSGAWAIVPDKKIAVDGIPGPATRLRMAYSEANQAFGRGWQDIVGKA